MLAPMDPQSSMDLCSHAQRCLWMASGKHGCNTRWSVVSTDDLWSEPPWQPNTDLVYVLL